MPATFMPAHPFVLKALRHTILILAVSLGAAHATTENVESVASAPAITAAAAEPSSSAQALFSRTKDGIVQVRVLLSSANEQSSLGSGFLVRDDGDQGAWVVTNYHVISALAIHPQRYRMELRGTNQRVVQAELVAIDVIHDLAVLRTRPAAATPTPAWPVLTLSDQALVQGSPVFSLGNPLELGFLISEGIYNGSVETRLYEQMLFSGSINSGMSGGPAIDQRGHVVGVNVATRRDGQQLSFLVPVRYASALLERSWRSPPRTEWRSQIAQQLLEHQQFVTQKMLGQQTPIAEEQSNQTAGFSTQSLSGRSVPTLHGTLTRCWAQGREGERLRYSRDRLNCSLREDVFVRDSLYTGTLEIEHNLLRNDKLTTPQFLELGNGMGFVRGGQAGELTPNRCSDAYIRGGERVYRAAICVRAYRKFPDLYDYMVRATQVDDARERLSSQLTLRGFSFDNAQQLGQLFLERLQ